MKNQKVLSTTSIHIVTIHDIILKLIYCIINPIELTLK